MTQVTSALMESTSAGDEREVLVRVEGVSKKFCRSLKKSLWYGVQDIASELVGRSGGEELRADEFWAVKDVSFELRRGECLGLIGRNGAGKSTLLRMLNGLIKPDQGRIEINGKVGGLIALGAGFNPVLTGRENVYVNGSILGLSKGEIDAKLEEIIDFAEIGEFIDAPVQTYSSGMNVRLGFAIAVILIKPDVLLLDEVLAVGDIGFTIKCLNAVRLLTAHSSVIFVSHNMQFVSQFCSEIMVMKQGLSFLHTKEVHEGIDAYLSLFPIDANIAGTGGALISKVHLICPEILSDTLAEEPIIPQGSQVYLEFEITNYTALQACLSIYIMDNSISPVICYYASNQASHPLNKVPKGLTKLRVNLGSLELNAGRYSFVVAVSDPLTKQSLTRVQGICPFRIRADNVQWGQFVRIPDVVFT